MDYLKKLYNTTDRKEIGRLVELSFAKNRVSNSKAAITIGVSSQTIRNKLKTGNFFVSEISKLREGGMV